MAETLAVRVDNTLPGWAVYRMLNGSFVQIGNTFLPGAAKVSGTNATPTNMAVRYRGALWTVDMTATSGGFLEIRKFDPSTGNWLVVYTSTNTVIGTRISGLYVFRGVTGKLALITAFTRSSTSFPHAAITTEDGITFTERSGRTSGGQNTGGPLSGVMFGNNYFFPHTHSLFWTIPAGSFGPSWQEPGGTSGSTCIATSFTVAQGRLFVARIPRLAGGDEYVSIYELLRNRLDPGGGRIR